MASELTPRRYRKKPVVVEAMLLTHENCAQVAAWCGGTVLTFNHMIRVPVRTLEGTLNASPGNWIVKGVLGEFYPCDPKAFAETYEEASDA